MMCGKAIFLLDTESHPFLAFELEYNYLDQTSNRVENSYIDNRITGRLVVNFQKAFQRGSNERKQ